LTPDACSSATAGLPRLNAFLTEFTSKIHNRPIPQPPSSKPKPSTTSTTPELSRPASPHHPTPSQTAKLTEELRNTATGEVTQENVHALKGSNANGNDDDDAQEGEIPWRVTVGGGCQDLLFKAFSSLLNRGDSILVETPVYAGVLPQLLSIGTEQIQVAGDEHGVTPRALSHVLSTWPQGKPKPRVLYVVPIGSNPTGTSSTTERKLEILEICVRNGIVIMEDDPYYFLAEERRPSFFELETRVTRRGGYVVRFDSFSKVLSSGMRLVSPGSGRVELSSSELMDSSQGFAAGPERILQAMDVHTSAANLQPNGLAQAVAYRLLRYCQSSRLSFHPISLIRLPPYCRFPGAIGGIKGFVEHGERVARFYKSRRDVFEAIAHKHLDGLARWVSPVAGFVFRLPFSRTSQSTNPLTPLAPFFLLVSHRMFLWIDVSPITDSASLVQKEALELGVLAVPGFAFMPNHGTSSFLRVSFSIVDLERDAELGFELLAKAIRMRLEVEGKK
jgi:tryptophan aminotransferase